MSDPVDVWMRGAARYPLLTAAQEVHLATMVRTWLDSPDPTPQQIRAGRRAKDRMVSCNLRLVAKRVFGFRRMILGRNGELSDALQEATIGLNRGVEKFDPTRGYKASTYLTNWIDQAIRRYVQTSVDTIRAPGSALDVRRRWRHKPADQSVAEFCEQWNLTPERLRLELQHAARAACLSLDQVCRASHEDSASLGDLIADPNSEYDFEQLDREEAIRALQDALPDDLAMVELSQTTTHKELAVVIGCDTRQVAHRLSSAKERLRGHLSCPVASKPRQNVVQINDYRPMTTSNGLQSLERLIEAPAAEPAAEPAPAKRRRTRRTAAQIAADKAAKAPELITMEIAGVTVKASATDCVALLKGLQAA